MLRNRLSRPLVPLDKNAMVVLGHLSQFPTTRSFHGVIQADDSFSPHTDAVKTVHQKVLARFQTLAQRSLEGGGARGIERHVKVNKKVLVRDRMRMLIDPGTEFWELGNFAGFDLPYGDVPAAGGVSGIGRVNGVYCMISGNDATVKAGTYYPITVQKFLRMQEISEANRLPSIYIPDSGGAFLPLQSLLFIDGGRSFYNQAVMSAKGIPQIAVVCGSCTAGGAYNPTMSDEAVIVDGIGKIFLGGPPLVKMAIQEVVSEEELGGAFLHSSVSGCTDYFAQTEPDAFVICRDIVEGLNFKLSITPASGQPPNQVPDWEHMGAFKHLTKLDLYGVLAGILDQSRFKEFKSFYGPGIVTGIGYIQGFIVGVVANWDTIRSPEALKATHFLDLCDRRQIPVIFLQNSVPSQESSTVDFDGVTLKTRGQLIAAVSTLTTPKVSVTLTSCDAQDVLLLCGPGFGPNFSFMWPGATLSSPDFQTAGASEESGVLDAFDAAANVLVDNIILPENTRKVLGDTLRIFDQTKRNPGRTFAQPVFRM